jgi:tetratricopeptide (TPR) repeat protein
LGALSSTEQKRLHEHVAVAQEQVLGDGVRAVAASLGRHYRLAGKAEKALTHYATALRRAVRLDDLSSASELARVGIGLCKDDDDRIVFELEQDKIYERQGDRAAQAIGLKALVRSAERTGDPRRQGQALHRVARFNVFGGDADKAEEAAQHALEFFRFDDDTRGQAQCLRVLSLARFERRDFDGAVSALEAARELTTDDDPRGLAVIEHQLGLMLLESGDVVSALAHLLEARSRKRDAGDLAGEGAVLDALADVFFRAGRPHVALDLADRAVALRDRIGDEPGRAQSTRHLAEISLFLGDPWNATNLAIEARQLARALSLGHLERSATLIAARAALQQGETDAAEPLIDGVRRRVDKDADPFSAREAAVLSARAKWMRAQHAEGGARDRLLGTALKRAEEARGLGERYGYATGQVLGTALAGAVYAAMGDAGNALMHAQRASELIEARSRTRLPVEEVAGPHVEALLAIGDDDDARLTLERAIEEIERNARRLPRHMRERYWNVPARAELKTRLEQLGS